jgi:hypothetical protein
MMRRLRILAAAILAIWIACAALAETEDTEREGGILGTGIVGTITALGSIYVNGQHILFDPDTDAAKLLPGHTVAVIARLDGAQWHASHIRQILPLVGPLQISADGQRSIMGTPIILLDEDAADIPADTWVAVSGLWQSGQVIATRIDRASPDMRARIEGTVFDVIPGQPLHLGGTAIGGLLPSHLEDGDVIRAIGEADGNSLQVSQLETGVFASAPGVVLIEGYFSVPTASGLYTVLGSNIVSYTDNPAMIDPAARQFVCSRKGQMFPVNADEPEAEGLSSVLSDCLSGHVE